MPEKKVKKNPPKAGQSKAKKPEHEIIKDEIVKEVVSLNHGKAGDALVRPNMAVVMIGEDQSANKFITDLEKEAKKVGIDTHVYKCPIDSDEEEIKAMMDCLNDDELIDGIYLQLPLPDSFKEEDVLSLVKTNKDLNYILDVEIKDSALREAKLFKGTLDNFKNKQIETL